MPDNLVDVVCLVQTHLQGLNGGDLDLLDAAERLLHVIDQFLARVHDRTVARIDQVQRGLRRARGRAPCGAADFCASALDPTF